MVNTLAVEEEKKKNRQKKKKNILLTLLKHDGCLWSHFLWRDVHLR